MMKGLTSWAVFLASQLTCLSATISDDEVKEGTLGAEIVALREDVQLLRQDLKAVVDLLEMKQIDPGRKTDKQEKSESNSGGFEDAFSNFDRQVAPLPNEFHDISLEEAQRMALAKLAENVDSDAGATQKTKAKLLREVAHCYWDLFAVYGSYKVALKGQNSALKLWRIAQARTTLGDTPPEAEARARAVYHQFRTLVHKSLYGSRAPGVDPRGLYAYDHSLRALIGMSQSDDKLLRPSDHPDIAVQLPEWIESKEQALEANIDIQAAKKAITEKALELQMAKSIIMNELELAANIRWVGAGDELSQGNVKTGSPEDATDPSSNNESSLNEHDFTPQAVGKRRALQNFQKSKIALQEMREDLREKEALVFHELARTWRDIQSARDSMKDYYAQWRASGDEAEILREKVEAAVGNSTQAIDKLLRAEELKSRTQVLYYQEAAEFQKARVNLDFLRGSLATISQTESAQR